MVSVLSNSVISTAHDPALAFHIYVTRSHKMSLNLKSGNLRYLQVSNLQVLLVILILKLRFSCKVNVDAMCFSRLLVG